MIDIDKNDIARRLAEPINLFCYKMTHDSGFAPNPFFGTLTLATCKPKIRLKKKVGDWIAGFTSDRLCGHPVGGERLIYLMKVESKLLLDDYFKSEDFFNKKPMLAEKPHLLKIGDNIYEKSLKSTYGYIQHPNLDHGEEHKKRDVSGKFVLASKVFSYFGRSSIPIPPDIRPDVPWAQAPSGKQTNDIKRAKKFIEYVLEHGLGMHDAPHCWPENDESWRESFQYSDSFYPHSHSSAVPSPPNPEDRKSSCSGYRKLKQQYNKQI